MFCLVLNYTNTFLTLSCLKPETLTPLLLLLLLLIFGLPLKCVVIFYFSRRFRFIINRQSNLRYILKILKISKTAVVLNVAGYSFFETETFQDF